MPSKIDSRVMYNKKKILEDIQIRKMGKEDFIKLSGVVEECLPGSRFSVKIENGTTVEAHLSGRMRRNFIKIIIGDRVKLEMSPYDLTKARIVFRNK